MIECYDIMTRNHLPFGSCSHSLGFISTWVAQQWSKEGDLLKLQGINYDQFLNQ